MNEPKNQFKMKLMWVIFMFGFITFTIGLILLYKYIDEKWQLETIEADSSYKLFNRNRVLHLTVRFLSVS